MNENKQDKAEKALLLNCVRTWKAMRDVFAPHTDEHFKHIEEKAYQKLEEIIGYYFDEGIQQIVGDLKKTEDNNE